MKRTFKNTSMARNIVEKIFDDAENVMKTSQIHMSPMMRRQGSENAGTNTASVPKAPMDVARTPMKHIRSPRVRKSPLRTARTPQARTVHSSLTETQADSDVHVFARLRPVFPDEEELPYSVSGGTIVVQPPTRSHTTERSFSFTDVFVGRTRQFDVFRAVAMPLLKKVMQGVDALLFAYGATGSGKTYTVQGTQQEPGLVPRIANILIGNQAPPGMTRSVIVSCVEVYNDKIIDLLGDHTKPLRLGKDGLGLNSVKGVVEIEIKNENSVGQMLQDIENARKRFWAKTNAAGRSHCVFMLKNMTVPIDSRTGKRTTDLQQVKSTRFFIVDLAGSERVTADGASAQIIADTSNVNKSMLVLGRCLRETQKKSRRLPGQAPFRESKLTEMFRDFFEQGNATRISVIVNISPNVAQIDDNLFALQFAMNATDCDCVRTVADDSDDGFEIHTIDFDDAGPEPANGEVSKFLAIEARIRHEVHEEMSQIMNKMQSDHQHQVEQIRGQSAQPYASKLQQALAQRMQTDSRSRELDQCIRERGIERARARETERTIVTTQTEMDGVRARYEEALKRNAMLESNITRMIEATKLLHQRFVTLRDDLTRKTTEKEAFWQTRIQTLEAEIVRLRRA